MSLSAEFQRIAKMLHVDPHTVLGFHREDGVVVLRAFRPRAEAVRFLLQGLEPAVGAKVHESGIFEATIVSADEQLDPARTRVETTDASGQVSIGHDPYFFAPTLNPADLARFGQGNDDGLYRWMGSHPMTHQGVRGVSFSVWAPHARSVRVVGSFNQWHPEETAMRRLPGGVWELFVPHVEEGALYKYEVESARGVQEKSDPLGRSMEVRPGTATRVVDSKYVWGDAKWLAGRSKKRPDREPMSIYEVHLQSWRKKPRDVAPGEPPHLPEHSERWLTYRELAAELPAYVKEMGFTHVELLPVMEHPYDGSWGYQVSGYFAPTSRLGSPDDFRYLIDQLHREGIGVFLDWVPAHFPKDAAALGRFDGTPLYEHKDPKRAEHRHWGTFIFDYGKDEVRNFLVASALYWLDEFHVDGLRVDAVASMLYLDYSARDESDWEPNDHGGNENLEAVAFVRDLNTRVHARFPGALVIAEESTSWPGVTKRVYAGGLGFDLKWNMGWMHDTLRYLSLDPIFRAFNHQLITFGLMYAYSESFLLPFSHDEVVHLKKSLYGKMDGDAWRKRASLRSLFSMMWAHPGKKLLFMGGEFGQKTEWNAEKALDWHTLSEHAPIQQYVKDLNVLYKKEKALFELDDDQRGFQWIDANDSSQSVFSFIRYARSPKKDRKQGSHVVFVANFTPLPRYNYRVGVPRNCAYLEALNSDAASYGGSNMGNLGRVEVEAVKSHEFEQSILLTLPPLACLFLVPEKEYQPPPVEVVPGEGSPA